MTLILSVSDPEALLEWAAARVGGTPDIWGPTAEPLGILDAETGRVRAVMVVNGFFSDAAMVHFASDGTKSWATRNILGGLFGYMFVFKRLARVIGLTPATNVPALKMVLMMGFRIEGTVRRSADSADVDVMTTMFAAQCPWIVPAEGEDNG